MTNSDRQGQTLTALAGRDIDALVFTAEMYGVQLDQLAGSGTCPPAPRSR